VADRPEIEGFIQLPVPPARAGFPPNRILFGIAGKIPYSCLGGFPPKVSGLAIFKENFSRKGWDKFYASLSGSIKFGWFNKLGLQSRPVVPRNIPDKPEPDNGR
jgi:hypothetical protein